MKTRIIDILIFISCIVLVLTCVFFVKAYKDYEVASSNYSNVYEQVIIASSEENERIINFDILHEESHSSCSWIYVPDTNIDYPLVQAADNEYYLTRDAFGNNSKNGAIFINCENNNDMQDNKTIIYGHNMNNGTMFHDLHKYIDNDFAISHSNLFIYMDDKSVKEYELYCVAKVDKEDLSIYALNPDETISDIASYLNIISDSTYAQNQGQKFVILSTCIQDRDRRIVVFQEKKEEH